MSEFHANKFWLRDAQLSAHSTSALPVWVWNADGTRILWANPVGAAIFGAAAPADLAHRKFDEDQAGAQIARIAKTLAAGGATRLERLRGFGASFGRALVCACSRIVYADQPAILIAAAETAGPRLSLTERARRLFDDNDDAVAVFSQDGSLLYANSIAAGKLGSAASLADIGAEALATAALTEGGSAGDSAIGALAIERIGTGANTVLATTIAMQAAHSSKLDSDIAAAAASSIESDAASSPSGYDAELAHEQRHPMRFVWQIDSDGRFNLGSGEFAEVTGPRIAALLNRPWADIAADLKLDPQEKVARAIATRNTWSGIAIAWPVDGSDERLTVELSGLPIFDRDRIFRGYRGFGVCRDIERITALIRARRAAPFVEEAPLHALHDASSDDKSADEEPIDRAMNVVPFRPAIAATGEAKNTRLNDTERRAFREIGRELTARLKGIEDLQSGAATATAADLDEEPVAGSPITARLPSPRPVTHHGPAAENEAQPSGHAEATRALLDRLPVGVLVYHLDQLIYANRAFLEWTGFDSIRAFGDAGGLDTLFVESESDINAAPSGVAKTLTISTQRDGKQPVEGRLLTIPWEGELALALIFTGAAADNDRKASEMALRLAEAENRELKAILDTATDGVILIDADGRILASNRSAEALFGCDARELAGSAFDDLFAPESRSAVLDYRQRLQRNGTASVLNDGREVIGRVRRGGMIPLFLTLGCLSESRQRYCAVFRDITAWKRTEEELIHARNDVEKIAAAKSEFLGKISLEIRTPLNTIIGFSEVMTGERFGPIGNERYLEYLKDIHAAGSHLVSLVDDLLDLSKIEAGKLDLAFTGVNLNEIARQCVAIMQPQANRERVIIRTSLSPTLPQVVADARTLRQIVINLLSSSIKFTGAGGQVIVSTVTNDDGQVAMRVRDTGAGMSEKDLQTALEPFRQLATSARWGASGTGLGLPLTKALTEANRAAFTIKSTVETGTLVEIAFPAARVLAG